MTSTISHHSALIYTMVIVSAADRDMTDREISRMGEITRFLPIFADFDISQISTIAEDCASLLQEEEGLEAVFGLISEALPRQLRETGYAVACEVAVADGHLSQEELRILEMIRHRLGVGRLPAAAIERGISARYATL